MTNLKSLVSKNKHHVPLDFKILISILSIVYLEEYERFISSALISLKCKHAFGTNTLSFSDFSLLSATESTTFRAVLARPRATKDAI